MRFLLRNVATDAKFEHRRGKQPSKVSRKPFIGGEALAPGATRTFAAAQLTVRLLEEIAEHQEAGNVQLLKVGAGEVNIPELLAQISGVVKTVKKVVEVVKEVAPVVKELVHDVRDALRKKEKDADAATETVVNGWTLYQPELAPQPASVIATLDVLAPPLPELKDPADPIYTADELDKMKGPDLQVALVRLGGKAKGKSKKDMALEILELQAKK
jgi:hypothetical protein